MSAFRETWDRMRQYPPLVRWLLTAALVVGVFLLWSAAVWDTSNAWDARSHEYLAALDHARETDQRISGVVQSAIPTIGEIEPIGNNDEGTQALSAVIIDVLDRHNAEGRDVQPKQSLVIKKQDMPDLFPEGNGQRAITEVRFEAEPEDAFKIIAELESSPAVETISKVQMHRSMDPRKKTVRVDLTVEAWVNPKAPASRPRQQPPAGCGGADPAGEVGVGSDVASRAANDEGSSIP